MIRAVIYCRTSTDEEVQLHSLDNQVADAKNAIEQNGWILVDTYIEARSGTTSNRTQYTRLYDDLLEDKYDVIVTKSIDRLNRSAKNWYLFLDRLSTEGKKLYFYMEGKFHSTDDALISGIKAILAEEYSRELSRKINHAHKNRQKNNGTVILTNRTYGFRKCSDKTVEVIQEEAEIKRKMYQLCASGYGCRTISTILANEGIFNRNGKPFTDSSILRIIRNPLNKGVVVMGKQHFDFDTKKLLNRPKEEWYVYDDKVPAIVSEELWQLANEQIDSRSKKLSGGNANVRGLNPGKYHLSGKLVCGCCKQPYYRQLRNTLSCQRKIYDWKCKTYLEIGRNAGKMDRPQLRKVHLENVEGCDNVHLEEEALNLLLQEVVENHYKTDKESIIRSMVELLKCVLKSKDYGYELEQLKKTKDRLSEQLSVLLDKLLSGIISDELYQKKQAEIELKLTEINEQIVTLEKQKVQQSSRSKRIEEIEKRLREGTLVENATVAGMLDEIEKVEIFPTYMEIYFSLSKMIGCMHANLPESSESIMRIDYGNLFNYRKKKIEERNIIVEMMRENPKITAKEIAQKINLSLSGVNYRIKVLRETGKIKYNGRGGHGIWQICEDEEVCK